jgi:hypothetical protein
MGFYGWFWVNKNRMMDDYSFFWLKNFGGLLNLGWLLIWFYSICGWLLFFWSMAILGSPPPNLFIFCNMGTPGDRMEEDCDLPWTLWDPFLGAPLAVFDFLGSETTHSRSVWVFVIVFCMKPFALFFFGVKVDIDSYTIPKSCCHTCLCCGCVW